MKKLIIGVISVCVLVVVVLAGLAVLSSKKANKAEVPGLVEKAIETDPVLRSKLTGLQGKVGQACWDLDGNGTCDKATEDTNGDDACDVLDCRGEKGEDGKHCYDGLGDLNGDGVVDVKDCQGKQGEPGAKGECDATTCNAAPTPAPVVKKTATPKVPGTTAPKPKVAKTPVTAPAPKAVAKTPAEDCATPKVTVHQPVTVTVNGRVSEPGAGRPYQGSPIFGGAVTNSGTLVVAPVQVNVP